MEVSRFCYDKLVGFCRQSASEKMTQQTMFCLKQGVFLRFIHSKLVGDVGSDYVLVFFNSLDFSTSSRNIFKRIVFFEFLTLISLDFLSESKKPR